LHGEGGLAQFGQPILGDRLCHLTISATAGLSTTGAKNPHPLSSETAISGVIKPAFNATPRVSSWFTQRLACARASRIFREHVFCVGHGFARCWLRANVPRAMFRLNQLSSVIDFGIPAVCPGGVSIFAHGSGRATGGRQSLKEALEVDCGDERAPTAFPGGQLAFVNHAIDLIAP
jgi:hypothetical protein